MNSALSTRHPMRNQQVLLHSYPVPAETLWAVLKRALTLLDGVTLKQTDDEQKVASFQTGMTSTSWGQNMIASLEPIGGGEVRLLIIGQIRHTFLSSNWGESLHNSGFARRLKNFLELALVEIHPD